MVQIHMSNHTKPETIPTAWCKPSDVVEMEVKLQMEIDQLQDKLEIALETIKKIGKLV